MLSPPFLGGPLAQGGWWDAQARNAINLCQKSNEAPTPYESYGQAADYETEWQRSSVCRWSTVNLKSYFVISGCLCMYISPEISRIWFSFRNMKWLLLRTECIRFDSSFVLPDLDPTAEKQKALKVFCRDVRFIFPPPQHTAVII